MSYLVLAPLSAALAAIMLTAPVEIVQAVAGVALFATFASACAGAMQDASLRLPAAVTLVVAASGVSAAGLSSAFWALAAGILVTLALSRSARNTRRRKKPDAQ